MSRGPIPEPETIQVREIRDGIHWLHECNRKPGLSGTLDGDAPAWHTAGRGVHNSVNAYLIEGEETLLFDTLNAFSGDQVVAAIRDRAGGLDYVAPSHPEPPHAGNTLLLAREFDAEIVAPSLGSLHETYHLGDATRVEPGEVWDLGGHTIEFCEPTFPDLGMSIWAFERGTRTLFTVDWLGSIHDDDECLRPIDELGDPGDEDMASRFYYHTGRALAWFHYADPAKVAREIDALIGAYEPAVLAPSHGSVIADDAIGFMELQKEVSELIAAADRQGVIA